MLGISPVLFTLGPFVVSWYALAYVGGVLAAWGQARVLSSRPACWKKNKAPSTQDVNRMIAFSVIGLLLGGRIGYVLIYGLRYYSARPWQILVPAGGGMSFHGGFLGTLLALYLCSRIRRYPFASFVDLCATVAPSGLFLGRIANFINGELWGRESGVPWALVFPQAGPLPRHPSQLYEALLEGLLLGGILWTSANKGGLSRPGLQGGLFIFGYGAVRTVSELFREPDSQIGFLPGGFTMGMALSLPMMAVGLVWIAWAAKRSH